MKEFFRQCPEVKKSECNINFFGKAIGRRAPECIEFFLDEGVAPSFGRHELEDMIVPMACGMWMHMDRLHPEFFQDPAFRMGLANSLASYMFDPAIYSKGWGFFRPEMMDHLARMNNSEYITHVMLIALPKAHIVHPDTDAALTVSHPWAEGIMSAVENELLTWPEIEGMTNDQPSRANYIGQVRSECERIKLQSQTHQAASVSKSGPRL